MIFRGVGEDEPANPLQEEDAYDEEEEVPCDGGLLLDDHQVRIIYFTLRYIHFHMLYTL